MTGSRVHEVDNLVDEIKPLLAGRPPEIVGAALAELLATFIVCHHPGMRDEILSVHDKAVREMIPVCEAELYAAHGKPEEWDAN